MTDEIPDGLPADFGVNDNSAPKEAGRSKEEREAKKKEKSEKQELPEGTMEGMRLLFFEDVYHEFRGDKINKGILTNVRLFLLKVPDKLKEMYKEMEESGALKEMEEATGQKMPKLPQEGYYGQAVITRTKSTFRGIDIVHEMHPVKIDLEKKRIVAVDPNTNLESILEPENIDEMLDKIMTVITQKPIAELKQVIVENPDPDDADWWKGQDKQDPNWWKKGGGGSPPQPPPDDENPEELMM